MNEEDKLGKDEAYFILKDMKDDIKLLNDKWHQSAIHAAEREQILKDLSHSVNHLTKILISGNGQPSVLVQISEIKQTVENLKNEVENFKADVKAPPKKEPTPQEVRIERIKLAAKIVAFLTVVAAEIAGLVTVLNNIRS